MFKTTFSEIPTYGKKIRKPYQVIFETVPDISRGVSSRTYYETFFTNKKDAFAFCENLDIYLEDVFFYADLIYFRLLSLSTYDFEIKQYKRNYADIIKSIADVRNKITLQKSNTIQVYQAINLITEFIDQVLILTPYYLSQFPKMANKAFYHLNLLKSNFIRSYRATALSADTKYISLEFQEL